jgi:hypothetical protein
MAAAQPLVPGPEDGLLEPVPLLSKAEAKVESETTFADHVSHRMSALDEMPPATRGQPLAPLLAAGELGVRRHRLTMVEASACVCHAFFVRV